MDHIVGHVVRRGLEAGHATFTQDNDQPQIQLPKIPAWGAILLLSTAVFFIAYLSVVSLDMQSALLILC